MLNTFRARSSCEVEAKFVQDRIVAVERTVAELCHVFAQYSRKAARLRDKSDEISRITLNHAEAETLNKTLSLSLENFAACISTLASYGDLRVQSLETKTIKELSRYEEICKNARDQVKQIYNAKEKEMARRRQLDRVRERNPRNRQQIIQAETELVKASAEFTKTLRNLEETSVDFERQKLHDMKTVLLNFITTEMGYHARSLEVLTNAYTSINSVNEEADLEEFNKGLRMVDGSRHVKPSLFRATSSMGSLGALFHKKRTPGIPRGVSKSEETLDSMKRTISDSEESLSDAANNLMNISDSDDIKESSFDSRKPHK